jgi:hypothetical protein
MKKYALLLVTAMLVLSCTDREKRPEVFLDEPQMIDVLADAYLIEAQLNLKKTAGVDVTDLQVAYYEQLFEHYGITDSIFEQNMAYYTRQPAILERVMDSVANRFARAQQ